MSSYEITTVITIGDTELPATVEFDYLPGSRAPIARGEYRAMEPDEPPSVEIASITFHNPKNPKRDLTITDGLIFDALTEADGHLVEQCFDYMGEDA